MIVLLYGQDHCPTLLSMTEGSGAGNLHGSSGPGFDPMQYYVWKDRQMHNGLVVVTWQLVDHPNGSGGLVWQLLDNLPRHFLLPILTCMTGAVVVQCVVPGTHKSNLRGPDGLYSFESHGHLIKQEETKAGDGKQSRASNHRSDLCPCVTVWLLVAFVCSDNLY